MFTENSSLVKNYALLINVGEKSIDDVPNYSNLREMVTNALSKSN